MLKHLARGALQAGGVVAGDRQGTHAHLQPTDHLVAARQLRPEIFNQMLEGGRFTPCVIGSSFAAAITSIPCTTISLTVLLM